MCICTCVYVILEQVKDRGLMRGLNLHFLRFSYEKGNKGIKNVMRRYSCKVCEMTVSITQNKNE